MRAILFIGLSADGQVTWALDMAELAAAFTPRTRALIVNTPHNPTGKAGPSANTPPLICTRSSPETSSSRLPALLVHGRSGVAGDGWQVLGHPRAVVIADEVYEDLVYDGRQHVRIASLPGMWDRTLTVSRSHAAQCGQSISIEPI